MEIPNLFYPVKPAFVNQPFGPNPNPTTNAIYLSQNLKGHGGIDFKAYHGQPIYASHDGTCFPTVDDHGGNGIILQADPIYNNFFTVYWHLIQDDAVVHTNQKVKAGELLGYADSTGVSNGDHCHFGLSIYPLDVNNGYQGHIDPTPYFNGKFAQDITPPPKFQFTKTLRIGMWNADVKALQVLLNAVQGSNLIVDGVFGVKTQLALKVFQTNHKLLADGVAGPLTNAALNTLL